MGQTIYAIGDIHGHIDELHQALNNIECDGGSDAKVVFIGDYCDRGPNSCQVIDLLIDGLTGGAELDLPDGQS